MSHFQLFELAALADPRFQAIHALCQNKRIKGDQDLRNAFERLRYQPSEQDIAIAWTALAVKHESHRIRKLAVSQLDKDALWKLTYQATTPIATVLLVGLDLRDFFAEDEARIFFDCTYVKVCKWVERVKTPTQVRKLSKLITFYCDMPFLIEDAYFTRFDRILRAFQETLNRIGKNDVLLRDIRTALHQRREDSPKRTGTLPENLGELPLPLQRQLAGQPHYLTHFVSAEDDRVALQTLRLITPSNVHRVLAKANLNRALLGKILSQGKFFTRDKNIALALAHPKCPPVWARARLDAWMTHEKGKRKLAALHLSLIQAGEVKSLLRNYQQRLKKANQTTSTNRGAGSNQRKK